MSVNNVRHELNDTWSSPQVPKRIHALVHPGFDSWEHPKFEKDLLNYIDEIAKEVHSVLLLVSDGEMFDQEQQKQFTLLRMIEGVSLYIWLHTGWIGDMIEIYNEKNEYSRALINSWLNESFYLWCKNNIDLSEINEIANKWRNLKQEYFAGKYSYEEHKTLAANLMEQEIRAKINIDIAAIAVQAREDLWVLLHVDPSIRRNIWNKTRFMRIYQYAIKRLWSDRMREIFIADAERSESLPIKPVSHFQDFDGKMISTPIVPPLSWFSAQVFNASEEREYGNASTLRDQITYELSVSRYSKLVAGQVNQVLQDMNFQVTPETQFIFSWEYRGRCVDNVARVIYNRLKNCPEENFLVARNITLQREDDREKEV